ncbi:MAG: lipoate--protein ligase family protein, partial [Victivallales bacterium]|nr:lipoate--protein ligase family protein [Victivallales bacterium]
MRVAFLPSSDPLENAAVEERLFRERPFPEEPRLLFYTNRECVQCGRNQDPSAECAVSWCEANGIPVIKRISGGGTVYHDLGNQNYAFLLPRRLYDPVRILSLAVAALHRIGVTDARFCQRFSVWHGDFKISGSAFALSGPAALLHGCLPFTTNLTRLHRALTPERERDEASHAVASVVSPVADIAKLVPSPDGCRERFCAVLAAGVN